MSSMNSGGSEVRKTGSIQSRAGHVASALPLVPVDSEPNARQVASGVLVNGIYKQLLGVSGRCDLDFLSVYSFGAIQTITVQIVIDGVEVFLGSVSTLGSGYEKDGMTIVGDTAAAGSSTQGIPLACTSSLIVNVKSDLSDTNKVYLAYKLRGIQ